MTTFYDYAGQARSAVASTSPYFFANQSVGAGARWANPGVFPRCEELGERAA
jgi:hypothetical protein